MKRFLESVRLTGPACAALLFLSMNPAAQATAPMAMKHLVAKVRVSYADLDLSRQSDVEILLGRIEKAAYRACGGNPRLHPSYTVMPRRTEAVFEECREDAVARAIDDVDAPVLTLARLPAKRN